MARVRNYQAEYARRIAKGLERGFTRAEARGHKEVKRFAPAMTDIITYVDKMAQAKQQHKMPKSFGLTEAQIRDLRKAKLTDEQIQAIINKRGGGVEGRLAVKGMLKNIKKKGHFPAPDEDPYGTDTIGQLFLTSAEMQGVVYA
jgi:hypothetical protein